jgi:predicted S18 family serine protease
LLEEVAMERMVEEEVAMEEERMVEEEVAMEEERMVEETEVVEAGEAEAVGAEAAADSAAAHSAAAHSAAAHSAAAHSAPPKPPDEKACTCWFATKGADPNNTIVTAIAAILKVIPLCEFITI